MKTNAENDPIKFVVPERKIIRNHQINHKLGYYIVDDQEFDSKINACLYAKKVVKPVRWIFNEFVFNNVDWKTEPDETLDQLYDLRARQLREKYDYIILSYSGGSDSHNILMSFYRQGLHIDEIVTNTMTKASEKAITVDKNNTNSHDGPESEHQLHAVNRLHEISTYMPKTKITVTDLSDGLFAGLEAAGDASWVLTKREGLNPAGMTRFNYLFFKDVRNKFDKDKSIALIMGVEKPRTTIFQGNLFITFADRNANQNTVAEHLKEYPNSTVEFFYWTPELTKIVVKQAHVIKNWLEADTTRQLLWKSVGQQASKERFRLIHEPILRDILYTTWNNNWFQGQKSIHDWYSEFDLWFLELYKDTPAYRIWKEGIDFVTTELKQFVSLSKEGYADGLEPIFRHYDLGPMKVLHPELIWMR